jgi:predicted nucleotidyltransferase
MLKKHTISTSAQKVLNYLLSHPNKPFHEREIARRSGISYGSANNVLNKLFKDGILQRKGEGKMRYYSVDTSKTYIKELKILNNLLLLETLVEKLKPHVNKIVLFGSWASGTDTDESDIDLFIVSSDEKQVRSIIEQYSGLIGKKIQAIIKNPINLLTVNKRKNVFMKQVATGKILWEREINDDNV